ncbi:uncharacterized protein LOC133427401 isoform X2 [Cololabis saira]|uniref:uncharacterized protein LOC133427401 isoform X2 n=1 Tax=Cololabis saira TaxID=129043 RepID=UPI002AD43C2F|nr:uncharacterized protein LOC133427401 isoform X2 [Cololabis saira]
MKRATYAKCSVVSCTSDHPSLHRAPASEDVRAQWVDFIFEGNVPATVSKKLFVCASHFSLDSFTNLGQFNAGLATRLCLKEGSVPTVRGQTADEGDECRMNANCQVMPIVRHVASQTDTPDFGFPKMRSVGTQLSMKTLQNHVRSTATQVKMSSRDCGVCTITLPLNSRLLFLQPTLVKRPSKRPRLSVPDEEEGPSDRSISTVVHKSEDST